MEAENEKLKKLLGEKELEKQILRDLIKKPSLAEKVEIAHKYISKGHPVKLVFYKLFR